MREAEEQTAAVMASGKPHALLFDCDGTLVDTMPMYLKSWTLTLAELDLPPLPAERFYSLGGMPVGKIFEMLLAEAGNTTITVEKCEETKRKHHQGLVERGEGVPPGIDVVIEFARKYVRAERAQRRVGSWARPTVKAIEAAAGGRGGGASEEAPRACERRSARAK
jgi:beta-phosphoglucomutase-like phosphatase (HAD superfamily)